MFGNHHNSIFRGTKSLLHSIHTFSLYHLVKFTAVIIPLPGEPIKTDSSLLYLVLSKGPEMRKLPDVDNKSLDTASQLLIDEGFIVLQEAEYSTATSGTVLGYVNHKAGDTLEAGSEVTLRVSKGQEITEE